jgi:hypothetical protein
MEESGLCNAYCDTDELCPGGSLCEMVVAGGFGLCTTPCDVTNPIEPCPSGFTCVARSLVDEYPYIWGGAYHLCHWSHLVREATADVGDPCIDPAPSWASPAEICRVGTVCVHETGGDLCRFVCNLGSPSPCPGPGETCSAPTEVIYSDRPIYTGEGGELGFCYP